MTDNDKQPTFSVAPQFAINEDGILGLVLGSVNGDEYVGIPLFHNREKPVWRSKNPTFAAVSPSGSSSLRGLLRELEAFMIFVAMPKVTALVLATCQEIYEQHSPEATQSESGSNSQKAIDPNQFYFESLPVPNEVLVMDEDQFSAFLDEVLKAGGGYVEFDPSKILQKLHNQNVDIVHATTDFSEIEKAVGNSVWYEKTTPPQTEFMNERLGEPYTESHINEDHPSRYRRRCNRKGFCGETIYVKYDGANRAFKVSCDRHPEILIDEREIDLLKKVLGILGSGDKVIGDGKMWQDKPIGTFDRIAAAMGLR